MASSKSIRIHLPDHEIVHGKKGKSSTLQKTWLLLNLPCANWGRCPCREKVNENLTAAPFLLVPNE
jgi:hypothetical protein